MMRRVRPLALLLALASATATRADAVRVVLPEGVATASSSGRVILFLVDDASRRLAGRAPAEAPFFGEPQPVASVAAERLAAGGAVTIDDTSPNWPVPLKDLSGTYRVQAVFKCNPDEGSHRAAGNAFSAVRTVEFAPDREDAFELRLSEVFPEPARVDRPNLRYVRIRSELLSAARGRDTFLRAGVALPPGYDSALLREKRWPTTYIVPAFGDRDTEAEAYSNMLATRGIEAVAPMAVHVVLDPEGPYGHHGFADSEANGPVGTALVRELIPLLEQQFRLDPRPEARIVTGHSSGGWSSIWLALSHPETFGACWASAPDPIDFTAFQRTDLYADDNLFTGPDGGETPSFRTAVAPGVEKVRMTVRQEIGVEHAMAPDGASGQQWGAWLAIFSSIDPATRRPAWICDPRTGAIRRDVVEQAWSRYDIARVVDRGWARLAEVLPRIRIAVGAQDSFYLERAVRRFAERVLPRLGEGQGAGAAGSAPTLPPLAADGRVPDGEFRLGAGPGYIWVVRHATHENVVQLAILRWNMEMRAWLGQQ